ncbi:hypothetical protein Leryth_010067 [Lithospermum erythrorhizon]|nr:hypothetical protein Leryth_010067 [Lithospermum erythrorhizon]
MDLNPQRNAIMLNSTKIPRKKRLNEEQVRLLEASFDCNKNLEPEMKLQLARQLGVPPRQIAIWYQNKRARWKNQSLEIGYNALQARLNDALLEKKQLEKQVKHLQEELQKERDRLMEKQYAHLPLSSISSCGDEGGGSGNLGCDNEEGGGGGVTTRLLDDVSCPWVDNGELLYACILMSASGQGDRDLSWQNDDSFLSSITTSRKM